MPQSTAFSVCIFNISHASCKLQVSSETKRNNNRNSRNSPAKAKEKNDEKKGCELELEKKGNTAHTRISFDPAVEVAPISFYPVSR